MAYEPSSSALTVHDQSNVKFYSVLSFLKVTDDFLCLPAKLNMKYVTFTSFLLISSPFQFFFTPAPFEKENAAL